MLLSKADVAKQVAKRKGAQSDRLHYKEKYSGRSVFTAWTEVYFTNEKGEEKTRIEVPIKTYTVGGKRMLTERMATFDKYGALIEGYSDCKV